MLHSQQPISVLETSSNQDKYINRLNELEEFQDEMFTSLSELASPAYYKTKLPCFSKREPLIPKFSTSSTQSHSTNSLNQAPMLLSTRDEKTVRTNQLRLVVERWRQRLNEFREKFEAANENQTFISNTKHREMLMIIEEENKKTSFPFIEPPDFHGLEQAIKTSNNGVVKPRLEASLNLYTKIVDQQRHVSHQQWLFTQSIADTHETMIDSILQMFYRDIYTLAENLKHYYQTKLAIEAKKFKEYTHKEKEMALATQVHSYKGMMNSVNEQCKLFRDMVNCLDSELDVLPLKDRPRMKMRLMQLHSRLSSTMSEAKAYYEASRSVVLPQSLSTYFCVAVRKWLNEYQSILIDALVIALINGENVDENKSGNKSTNINMTNLNTLKQSHLFNYAKQMDRSRLADLAHLNSQNHQNTRNPGNNNNSNSNNNNGNIDRTNELLNDIFMGFTEFHFKSNKSNMAKLQELIRKTEGEYNKLKTQFQKMKSLQQRILVPTPNTRYNNIENKSNRNDLNNVQHQMQNQNNNNNNNNNSRALLPSVKNNVIGRKNTMIETDPRTIRDLLQLEKDAKISEATLKGMYDRLMHQYGPEYQRMEQQNVKLVQIIQFLRQYSVMMRDWENKIKEEHIFLKKWKEIRLEQTDYLSTKFMEWNHFVTGEVDTFYSAIGIYSVTILTELRHNANDFMTTILKVWQTNNDQVQNKLQLVNLYYDDIKKDDLNSSDLLIRLQNQMEQWTNSLTELYQVYFDHRFNCVIASYLATLEQTLAQFNDESELAQLLNILDNMYDTKDQDDEEYEFQKFNFVKNKLKIQSQNQNQNQNGNRNSKS